MSKTAWPMSEEQKLIIGQLIIETAEGGPALPTDPAKGKKLLEDRGFKVDGSVKGVVFDQSDADGVMHISVPPLKAVQAAYERLKKGGKYAVPETYTQMVNGTSPLSEEDKFKFRLGDYSISHCT